MKLSGYIGRLQGGHPTTSRNNLVIRHKTCQLLYKEIYGFKQIRVAMVCTHSIFFEGNQGHGRTSNKEVRQVSMSDLDHNKSKGGWSNDY